MKQKLNSFGYIEKSEGKASLIQGGVKCDRIICVCGNQFCDIILCYFVLFSLRYHCKISRKHSYKYKGLLGLHKSHTINGFVVGRKTVLGEEW